MTGGDAGAAGAGTLRSEVVDFVTTFFFPLAAAVLPLATVELVTLPFAFAAAALGALREVEEEGRAF